MEVMWEVYVSVYERGIPDSLQSSHGQLLKVVDLLVEPNTPVEKLKIYI